MSLSEALLLDPYTMDVYVANRTDGVSGSGTQNDPFDGSTQSKFDAVMNSIATYTCVHLAPGTFKTNGYTDSTGGAWQSNTGTKIVGFAIDVTTLQLVANVSSAHFFANGHAVLSGTQAVNVDYFEVSDLTIDCNHSAFTGVAPA